jgi:hypothetical protein
VGCDRAGGAARDVARSEDDAVGAVCVLRVRGTVVTSRKAAMTVPVDDHGVIGEAPYERRAFA